MSGVTDPFRISGRCVPPCEARCATSPEDFQCGTDGRTYFNTCFMACVNVQVRSTKIYLVHTLSQTLTVLQSGCCWHEHSRLLAIIMQHCFACVFVFWFVCFIVVHFACYLACIFLTFLLTCFLACSRTYSLVCFLACFPV